MGHNRLGRLPASRKWQQVVAHLDGGAAVPAIAAGAAEAAEGALKNAAADPGFSRAFWLLTQLPLAARESDFENRLRNLDVRVGPNPGLLELAGAASESVERNARRTGGRTDFGEMAQLSLAESLAAMVGHSLPGLFGATSEEVRKAVGSFASRSGFSDLTRDFFARLTRRYLQYYLSRELANHVGRGERFASTADHQAFDHDLDRHTREAARILKEFAGEWFSKGLYQGNIDPSAAQRFAYVAFRKVRNELRRRRVGDA